jgi:predicted ATPase
MGKSSLIQTLLLLRQSFEKNTLFDKGLLLIGDYINLGVGQDILSEHAEEETFEFLLTWKDLEPAHFSFDYAAKSDLQPVFKINKGFDCGKLSLFNKNFQYLAADRVSPKSVFGISDYYINNLNSIGIHGEFAVHLIAEYGLNPISIKEFQHKKAVSLSLLDNIDKWMSELSPGIRIHAEMQPTVNSVSLSYAFEQGKEMTADFKPQNVGFGLTFVLPVIVALLRSKPGDMLIIENPEAHLHPGGQAILGKLCSIAAANGVQLFIETHSDHFLNGIRVAVKEKVILNDTVKLFFLERHETMHSVTVVSPEIGKDGKISRWPRGFFDEGDKQLEKLL